MAKKPNPLSKLPLYIRKKNSKYYIDTRTGSFIHISKIKNYLPVEPETLEQRVQDILEKRWDLNH